MEEPDEPRRKSRLERPPLDGLGVAELRGYVDELKAEIERAEAAIAAKQGHRAAADTFFKKS